jgi:type IX secretion system PorP/SprF family membrane protein
MKQFIKIAVSCICVLIATKSVIGQGLHFSQISNVPMFVNPAYTGLLQEDDYRIGVVYRNQASTIPVPYNTTGAFADLGILRNGDKNSWIGIGASFFNDVASSSRLRLTSGGANVAYHLMNSSKSMISFGTQVNYVGRRIDLSSLTFDKQWDEFSYNNDLPSQEKIVEGVKNYADINIGGTYSFYNNENYSVRTSVAVNHINMPKETFLDGTNRLAMRPIIHLEADYKTGKNLIISPMFYYTTQKRASEMVFGSTFNFSFMNGYSRYTHTTNQLILGAYHRLNDAIIGMAGYKYKSLKFGVSTDITTSKLKTANNSNGAIEFSIIHSNLFGQSADDRRSYGCPRF